MAGRFDGRVALVTGGASGIGAATVRRLHAEGARVLSCGVLNLLLRDELAPFELFEGKSLFQVPEVSAVSLFAGWVHDPEQAYWQFAFSADSIAFEVVPEPKASLLLGLGLAAVGWRRRRAGPPA